MSEKKSYNHFFQFELDEVEVPAIQRFSINSEGRDFVVGDIHGMFHTLEALLEQVDFNLETDRLFSVGDLIDRGPYSHQVLNWLDQPWFHACRGNHEQFVINSLDPYELSFWVENNGGAWWLDISIDEQNEIRKRFLELPLAMEVQTSEGKIAIVHADVSSEMSWENFCDLLVARDKETLHDALFSRERIYAKNKSEDVPGENLKRIFCGHTPVREPVTVNNVHFIDTAAVYAKEGYVSARLMMVELEPSTYKEYAVFTDS